MDDDYSDVIAAATTTPPKPQKMVRGIEKLKGVQPDLINHWNNLQTEFDKQGLKPVIKSGYRTLKNQQDLYNSPATHALTKGNDGIIKISPHQEGRALDISFAGPQKEAGRRIIADYAKRNNLYVPSDEPWHIAIPKQKVGQSDDDYADVVKAAMGGQPETAQPDSYDDVIAAATPAQVGASATAHLPPRSKPRTQNVTNQVMEVTAQAARLADQPRGSLLPVNPSKIEVRSKPFTFKGPSDEEVKADIRRRVADEAARSPTPGGALVGPEIDTEVENRFQQYKQNQAGDVQYARTGPSMSGRNSRLERAGAAIAPYTPGLANLDTPMGIKTDPLRGAASLGLADLSREVSPEESALDPEAQSKANLAYGIGATIPAVLPYVGAGKLAARAIPGATRGAAAARTAATFGGVGALREGVRSAQTGEAPSLSNVAIDTAVGTAMGGIAGISPSMKRQIVAFVTPGLVAGVARGEKLPELAQSAVTNLLFGLHSGAGEGKLTAKRIGELREQLGGSRVSEVRDAFDAIKNGVPEKPEALQAQLDQRGYTLVPEGAPRPSLPRGTRIVKTADGVVYFDPKRIDAKTILNTPTAELLGHVEEKSPTTTETVVARAPDGSEIQSSAVSPENVEKQATVMQAQYPEAKVETGDESLAANVIAERVTPQEFYHKDWGNVVETESQVGAGKGRVRVAEKDNPDAVHYPKRIDLSGRGNQRLVPLARPAPEAATEAATNTAEQGAQPAESTTTPSPLTITKADEAALLAKGYSEDYIYKMTPEEAQVRLASVSPEIIAANQAKQTPSPESRSTRVSDREGGYIHDDMQKRLSEAGFSQERIDAMSVQEKAKAISEMNDLNRRGDEMVDERDTATPEQMARNRAQLDFEQSQVTPESQAANDAQLGENLTAMENEARGARPAASPTGREVIQPSKSEVKGEPNVESTALASSESIAKSSTEGTGVVGASAPSTKPDFVQAAIERKAAREAEHAKGIRYKSMGADPYELIDNIIIKGHELYTEKIKPTFEEWSRKLREEFGPKADKHLKDTWAKLEGRYDETSATKASMAQDRVELDLPDLPPAERKSWQTTLDNARDRLLPERALATAESVLQKPRALDDEDTAGLVLKAQEIKNSHATAMERIANENDPDKLRDLRIHTEMLQDQFDTLSDALKQSGSEKGRALASQKLTINQDYDLVSLKNRYKQKTGKNATGDAKETIEKQAGIIKDLQTRLDAHEERLRNDSVSKAAERIRREVARETRNVQRGLKKADLDTEAQQLKQLIAASWKKQSTRKDISGMAAIDPEAELSKLILKLARNRLKANLALPAADLLDEVHGILQDVTDLDRRRVAEIISGYGRAGKPQSEETRQLNLLKTELRRGLEAEDVAAGKRSAKREGPPTPPKYGPRESWPARKAAIEKQIAELERRTTEGDFSKRKARGQTVYDDPQSKALMEQLGRAKLNYERKLRQWEDENRSMPEKVADLAVKWGRAAKLSYMSTLGKLFSAATGRIVLTPLENILGEIPHRLMPKLSAKATTEGGGFSKAAEVAALWKSGRFRQVINQLRSGASDLDLLYGPHSKMLDKEMSGEGVLGIPGRVHGAMKEYPRQVEFDRAFIKVLKAYEKAGRDITQPSEQLAARMEAFNAAERARFQQRNVISDTFNSAMGALEQKGLLGKGLAKTGKFLFPIVRVPVNVAAETLNYSFGIPRAAIETAIRGGVKNLTPDQANNIMRAYKKGGVGLAVMAYAFLNPQQFGGYYQKNDKRKPDEPKPGEIMFFGHRIPKALTHIPILEAAQLAATSRRIFDKLTEKGESKSEALVGGASAGLKGVAEGVPFYETPARYFTGKEGTQGTAQLAGEQVRGMIPGFVQEYAKARDTGPSGTPAIRRPSGSFAERFAQTVKMGVPVARETVPIGNVFGSKVSKASDEAERLQVPMVGAVKNADETPEEFKTREVLQNANIRTQLENVVALPDYDKASDADKAKWLKQAAEFASANTRDQLPEKKEKKEERQFPMPQSGFERAYPADSLNLFEKMSPAQQVSNRASMARKAKVLLNDPRLSAEKKAEFKKRLDTLGIAPMTTQPRSYREQLSVSP